MKDIERKNYFQARRTLLLKRAQLGLLRSQRSGQPLAKLRGRIDAIDNDIMLIESILLDGGVSLTRTTRFFE